MVTVIRKIIELAFLVGLIVLTLSVSFAYADPYTIRDQIISELNKVKDLGKHDFDVDVRGQRVLLEGFVSTLKDRERVENIARGVKGVDRVDNKLIVQTDSTSQLAITKAVETPPTDSEITDRVLQALKSENVSGLTSIKIETRKGVVHFSGSVNNHREIDRMLSLTLMVDGVKSVRSDVKIMNSANPG